MNPFPSQMLSVLDQLGFGSRDVKDADALVCRASAARKNMQPSREQAAPPCTSQEPVASNAPSGL